MSNTNESARKKPAGAVDVSKTTGRPKAPRLGERGRLLRKLASAQHGGSLTMFHQAAQEFCTRHNWPKAFASIKREFERAFDGTGPFSEQLQEIYEQLVGIPDEVKKAIDYIPIKDSADAEKTFRPSEAAVRNPSGLGQPSVMQLLHSSEAVKAAQLSIVAEATTHLAATGSWSRNSDYFGAIEKRLQKERKLRYYRVLCGPPKTKELVEHLRRLVLLRDPDAHEDGRRTLCIGVTDIECEPERLLVTSEHATLVALPSVNRFGDYDTALLIRDSRFAERFTQYVHDYFIQSRRLITKAEVLEYLEAIQLP